MKEVDKVLQRIIRDIKNEDTTSLEIMLQNVPETTLNTYLGGDEGYQMVGRDGNPIREGDEVWVGDVADFGTVIYIASDADDEYYARVQIGDITRCVYDDNIELA